MTLPDLKRLWRGCAALALSAGVFLGYFHACERSTGRPPHPPAGPLAEAAAVPPPPAPAAPLPEPRYTYIGPAQFSAAVESSGDDAAAPKPLRAKPRSPAAAAADTLLALGRQTENLAALGAIPDLDIRLAGVNLQQVVQRYGYVAAVKSRTRLLGKIVGAQFVPLTPAEISRYARRGRSGADHPEAGPWLRRIAAELQVPQAGLQFIFLVPRATEQIFIAAEMAALARAGRSAQDIALVTAHFDADLAIVVDALLTKAGETVPVDSVRLP